MSGGRTIERACDGCGRPYTVRASKLREGGGRGRFCSRSCGSRSHRAGRIARIHHTCAGCGAIFSAYASQSRRFCSRSCAARSRRRPTATPRPHKAPANRPRRHKRRATRSSAPLTEHRTPREPATHVPTFELAPIVAAAVRKAGGIGILAQRLARLDKTLSDADTAERAIRRVVLREQQLVQTTRADALLLASGTLLGTEPVSVLPIGVTAAVEMVWTHAELQQEPLSPPDRSAQATSLLHFAQGFVSGLTDTPLVEIEEAA